MLLRRNRRDLCRQLLAGVLQEDAALQTRRRQVEQERLAQLQELKQAGGPGEVDVAAAAARRYYAGRLAADVGAIDRERRIVAQQIAACRAGLVKADQDVRVLERLEERQRSEFEYQRQRSESLALEDVWFAQRARSTA